MFDIYLSLIIVTALSLSLSILSYRLCAKRTKAVRASVAATTMTLLFVALYSSEDAHWAMICPIASLPIWVKASYLLPTAFLAGLAPSPGLSIKRGFALGAMLWLVTFGLSFRSFLEATPKSRHHWRDDCCVQSHQSTCGAAAAATLLAKHGLTATEAEMVELCLTKESGTTFFGIYRGLKIKTEGSPWTVEAFVCDEETLYQEKVPALLSVWLEPGQERDPRYESEWGWREGSRHAIVLNQRDGYFVNISDPAIGNERWGIDSMKVLWHGVGLRLVPR
ncbi:MAG: cysteine peptidase family C39 domain-containing protein [Planctomycetota bacterium]|nr:cysteine peptidase family C39 domain-containing protein [Planctomycetota bacterium]